MSKGGEKPPLAFRPEVVVEKVSSFYLFFYSFFICINLFSSCYFFRFRVVFPHVFLSAFYMKIIWISSQVLFYFLLFYFILFYGFKPLPNHPSPLHHNSNLQFSKITNINT